MNNVTDNYICKVCGNIAHKKTHMNMVIKRITIG